MVRLHELLFDEPFEKDEQRTEEAVDVEQAERFGVNAELGPGPSFEKFL